MSPVKFLVVDDDKLICWALQREFVSLNINTCAVGTAADALAEIRKDFYDLIFLDIHLPDGNGIDMLEEIDKISPDSKVVIMSADASHQNRQRALDNGALQFLEKPFERSEIHSLLRAASGEYPRRRKHRRCVCRVPVRISIVVPAPEEAHFDLRNLQATMGNIAAGGLMLRTDYPLMAGQGIRISLVCRKDPFSKLVPPDTLAEVIWVAHAGDGTAAGVRFLP